MAPEYEPSTPGQLIVLPANEASWEAWERAPAVRRLHVTKTPS
jgi:hypothetical protein